MGRKALTYWGLAGVLILATALRLYKLSAAPPSLNWDEAAVGYNAYSLLETGRDEYGTPLPLTLRSFDDYKPAMYSYLAVPIIKFFGLSEMSVRSVSAAMGVISILLVFIVGLRLSKNKVIAFIAALLVAIEPWAIFYSRGAWEANLSLTLILVSVGMVHSKRYGIALTIAALNTFAYHSAKVYFFLFASYIFFKARGKYKALAVLMSALVVFGIFVSGGTERFASSGITKVLTDNKSPYVWVTEIGQRYAAYFSPANLFVRGTNESGQKVPGYGPFYAWEFVFWAIGLVWLIKNRQKYKWLLSTILLAPIPAILTWSWFNPVRVLPLLVSHSLLVAVGIDVVWRLFKGNFAKLMFALAALGWGFLSLARFGMAFVWQLTYYNYGDWQWGFRETVAKIQPLTSKYDKVVWETPQAQPYIFVLFYSKYPPAEYQKESINIAKPRKVYDFGKYEFRKIYWPDDVNLKKILFVGGVYSLPIERAVEKVIDPQEYEMYRIVVND